MKMKKIFALVLAMLMVLSLAACGGDKNSDGDAAAVAGETYDTGMFTVTVPKGWLAVPAEGDASRLTLIKDGKTPEDQWDKASINLYVCAKGELMSTKDWYDDVKDLDPVTVSGFDCQRYTCTSGGWPYDILEGTGAKGDVSISILTENSGNKIAFGDADVQTILGSIAVK